MVYHHTIFHYPRKILRQRRLQNLTVIRYDIEWLRGRVYDRLTDTNCQRRRHTFLIKTIVSRMKASMKAIAGLSRQIMYYIDKWCVKLEAGMIVKWTQRWFEMEKRVSSSMEARKEESRGDIEGPHARAAHRYAITWLQPTWSACACPLFVTGEKKRGKSRGGKERSILSHSHLYASSLGRAYLPSLI